MIQPPFPEFLPESAWIPPSELPDFVGRGAKRITIDVESRDPNLKAKGPGYICGDAYVVGVAVKVDNQPGKYYPVRHNAGMNLAPNVVFPWLQDQLKGDEEKCGANLLYDLEALHHEGVTNIGGKLRDIQIAEPLIDEETTKGYSLNVLSEKYLGKGKAEDLLRRVAEMYKSGFKGRSKGIPLDPKSDLWQLDAKYVGLYAEGDVDLPSLILDKQQKIIDEEGLQHVFDMESDLIRVLLKMRIKGTRVDLEKAQALSKEFTKKIEELALSAKNMSGGKDINPYNATEVFHAFERYDKKYGLDLSNEFTRTAKAGLPSLTNDWLEARPNDPLCKNIAEARELIRLRDKFINTDIIGCNVKGRIHSQFHSLRQDQEEGSGGKTSQRGTRTGRFSSSSPNLQQVPKRGFWAKIIRDLFIADEGMKMLKADYSQQEPRLLVHFAALLNLPGSEKAVAAFHKDPLTDYHRLTMEIVNDVSGRDYIRDTIKGINLGIMYSMGLDKLCKQLGLSREEGMRVIADYQEALPFVRALSTKAMSIADQRGYIKTISNRRRRFDKYAPEYDLEGNRAYYTPLPLDLAQATWPGRILKRAGIHKALNSLIQGSAADQTKYAMLALDRVGLTPQMQVHDELVASVYDAEEARRYKFCMETCITIKIPVVAESMIGSSWGNAKQLVELPHGYVM